MLIELVITKLGMETGSWPKRSWS